MKSWSTLLLALVTLGLLVYLYSIGLDMPGTKEMEDRRTRVFDFDADAVDRLEITAGESVLLIKKQESGAWSIEKPITTPADLTKVRQVLGDLEFARRRGTLSKKDFQDYEKALESMGLKKPKVRLGLRQGRKVTNLAIGNETARAGQFYALISDGKREEMIIVERAVEEAALHDLSWFRKREVFDFQTPLVTGITLRRGEQETELTRNGDAWAVVKPVAGPADETRVVSYLAELLSGKVVDFVADGPGDVVAYGLSTPVMVLEVRSGENAEQLRIGQPVPGQEQVYAQISGRPQVFSLPKTYIDQLGNLLDRTQDRRVLAYQDPFEIGSLKIQSKGLDLLIRQEPARTWSMPGASGRLADPARVNAFLSALRESSATRLVAKSDAEAARLGLAQPAVVVSVTRKADETRKDPAVEEIRFSAARKGVIHASTPRLPFILELPDRVLAQLPAQALDWFDKSVTLHAAADTLRSITWQRPSESVALARTADGAWPPLIGERPLDSELFNRQQALLGRMAVDAWVPVKETDFTKPRFSLVLETKEGGVRTVDFALLGNPQEYRGRIRGEREMFVIRGNDPQALEQPPLGTPAAPPETKPAPVPANP